MAEGLEARVIQILEQVNQIWAALRKMQANPLTDLISGISITATEVNISNDSTERTLFSKSIRGGTLGTGNFVLLIYIFRLLNNTIGGVTHTLRVKYGSDTPVTGTFSIAQSASAAVGVGFVLLKGNGATNAQKAAAFGISERAGNALPIPGGVGTSTRDSTTEQTFSLTMQLGTADANAQFDFIAGVLFRAGAI